MSAQNTTVEQTSKLGLAEAPLVSILTPTWNCAETLSETLESVIALEALLLGRCEHLIGDSVSTDGTAELLQAYAAPRPWVKLRQIKGSIPVTLNALLPEMSGRWVVVMNGDDRFDPAGTGAALKSAPETEDLLILCGAMHMLDKDGNLLGKRRCDGRKIDTFMSVNHQALLVNRSVFATVGAFDTDMPTSYDYGWVWRAWRQGVEFRCHDEVWAEMRLGGISDTRSARAHAEIFRFKRRHGAYFSAIRGYGSFHLKAFARRILPRDIVALLVQKYRGAKHSIDEY